MKNKIYYLFLLISFNGIGQSLPICFTELKTDVSTRGIYNQESSVLSEVYYNYNTINNSFEENLKVTFGYQDGKCTAESNNDVQTYEFKNNRIDRYLSGLINLESQYTYDSNNRLIESTLKQSTTNNRFISTYNGDQIIRQELYDTNNALTQYFDFEYNSNGSLNKRTYSYSTEDKTEETYSYLNNKLSEKKTNVYTNETLSSTAFKKFEYNTNNKLKTKLSYSSYDSSKYEYNYDLFNNIKTETRYALENGIWVLNNKKEYSYNYNISIEEINLPASIMYSTKAFSPFELPPNHHYTTLIPKYENGEIINFINEIKISTWDTSQEKWTYSRKIQYNLDSNIPTRLTSITETKPIIYPNPNTGKINISFNSKDDVTINIYNIDGRLVLTKNRITSNQYCFFLDAPQGAYIIEIKDNEKTYRLKINKI